MPFDLAAEEQRTKRRSKKDKPGHLCCLDVLTDGDALFTICIGSDAGREGARVGKHEDPAEKNGHKPDKPIPPPNKDDKGDGKRGK